MKKYFTNFLKDESAQGATEYILLLVAVVGMVFVFKEQIRGKVEQLIGRLSGEIDNF